MKGNGFAQDWKLDYLISGAAALLMTIASAAGIVFQSSIYPTEEFVESFVTNDFVNLIVGLPVILVVMWLAHRGRLAGWLFWPGALFYIAYNYLVYLFSMPLNAFYVFFPLIVGLSMWGIFRIMGKLDGEAITGQLEGKMPARLGGGVLALLGAGFLLRAVGVLVSTAQAGELTATVVGLNLSDTILSLVWIIGGVALWRRTQLGYTIGGGLLYQGSMLFVALILLIIVQPLVIGGEVAWVDVIVLAVMSLVVLIPFGMFVKGIARA